MVSTGMFNLSLQSEHHALTLRGMETITAVNNNSGRNAEIATYTVALNRVAVPVA
jgi:hypothetical protein